MAKLVNEFSWSFSRHRIFDSCKRQYYYHYYGSWGGWEDSTDELTRRLYQLKNMVTLPMLAGDVVHRVISIVLESLKRRRKMPPEKAEAEVIQSFRKAWKESKNGEWKQNPKWKTNLFEHYYKEKISDDKLFKIKDTLVESIHGFYLSDSFAFIQTLSPSEWITKEEFDTFNFHGTRVWVKLDFAARHGERIYIYDWKTGEKVSEDETQLAIYALYALDKWGIELKDLRLFDIYLKKQLPVKVKLNRALIAQAEDVITQSIDKMKELLDDEFENTASIGNFPMIDNSKVCRRCVFKGVCYPNLDKPEPKRSS